MSILKEWHGKGGSVLARFYSCVNTNGTLSYFVDFKMCTVTVDVTCGVTLDESSFFSYTNIYGIPYRYARFVYQYLKDLSKSKKTK